MFGAFKKMVSGSVQKYSGRTDFLEAVCAAAALVAAADGDIEDAEVDSVVKTVTNHPDLSGAFDRRTIENTIQQMLSRAQTGRVGKMGLYKEIDDIANDGDMAETVYLTALDVSESDGEIEPQEKEVLAKIAERLKIDTKKYA